MVSTNPAVFPMCGSGRGWPNPGWDRGNSFCHGAGNAGERLVGRPVTLRAQSVRDLIDLYQKDLSKRSEGPCLRPGSAREARNEAAAETAAVTIQTNSPSEETMHQPLSSNSKVVEVIRRDESVSSPLPEPAREAASKAAAAAAAAAVTPPLPPPPPPPPEESEPEPGVSAVELPDGYLAVISQDDWDQL